jgi:glycosyltransferase involved in cell wall biosynthesis
MSSGLAVVATDVGETRNMIRHGENGLLVPSENPQALASAILSLLTDKSLYSSLSREALNSVRNFDVSALGPKYSKLYRDALNEN